MASCGKSSYINGVASRPVWLQSEQGEVVGDEARKSRGEGLIAFWPT